MILGIFGEGLEFGDWVLEEMRVRDGVERRFDMMSRFLTWTFEWPEVPFPRRGAAEGTQARVRR